MFAQQAEVDARPRLVLCQADPAQAVLLSRTLGTQGWQVHLAVSGPEARKLARERTPSLVVLDAELPRESGWLTCAKLVVEQPGLRVVLLAPAPTPEQCRFAEVAGAIYLTDCCDVLPTLLRELEAALPTV